MAQTIHTPDALDPLDHISMREVANLCGLSLEEVQDLIDYGALQYAFVQEGERYFACAALSTLVVACKQRRDYDLDLFSVVLLSQYLEDIAALQAQLRRYQLMFSQ